MDAAVPFNNEFLYHAITSGSSDVMLQRILTDREIVDTFQKLLQYNEGLVLGQTGYYDDTSVDVVYGITNDRPDQMALFIYENSSTEMQRNLRFMHHFPNYSNYAPYFDGWPRPERLLESLIEKMKKPWTRPIVQFYDFPLL